MPLVMHPGNYRYTGEIAPPTEFCKAWGTIKVPDNLSGVRYIGFMNLALISISYYINSGTTLCPIQGDRLPKSESMRVVSRAPSESML
jgi:hypothetical protein